MMSQRISDHDFGTPPGALETDEEIWAIRDSATRIREWEKKHRLPDVEVIYCHEDLPRKNLEDYYYKILWNALARNCPKIVIEPSPLGQRVGQYINMGFYMHWACVVTGSVAILLGLTFRHKIYVIYSCSLISCALLHASNLYYRNCLIARYKYVEDDEMEGVLKKISPEIRLYTDCPTILVPYDATKRRIWTHIFGCSAGIIMGTLIYRGLPILLCRCPDGVIPQVWRYEGNLFEFFGVLPITFIARNSAPRINIMSDSNPKTAKDYLSSIFGWNFNIKNWVSKFLHN